MIPGYPGALDTMLEQRVITELRGSFPDGRRLIAGVSPISALPVIMFDRPSLFGRDGGRRRTATQPHQLRPAPTEAHAGSALFNGTFSKCSASI
jgi:hypothetical protein